MNKAARAPSRTPVLVSLLQAAHAVERRLEDAFEVGLSVPKFGALTSLIEAGEPMSLGDLAIRLTCVRSNITQLVDRLEADGLVRRVEDPVDRRGVRAVITALGRERQAAGARQLEQVQDELAGRLGGIEAGELVRALARLC